MSSWSGIEVHPSKCCRFFKKSLTGTKIPHISLFAVSKNKVRSDLFPGEDSLVLVDIIASLGHKLARHEVLSQVTCTVVVLLVLASAV